MHSRRILIVGAGLSGLCVASQLIEKGANVTLVDNNVNYSSRIAAGMINPLVFRRMTKGWRVDEFVPFLQFFYVQMEEKTGTSFFHPIVIRRMFSSEHERELWLKKQSRDDFSEYMHVVTSEDDQYDRAINNFGSGRIKNGAYVDTEAFLNAMKSWVEQNGAVINGQFDYTQLKGTTYNRAHYDDIVFCEGYLGKENPWFGSLPLHQTKGETLTIHSAGIPEDESVNRKCFILPLGNQSFKVGSTYEWHTSTLHTTELGRATILEKAAHLTDAPIEVIDQAAGIRPTVIDRRPLIGTHQSHANYHVFNGLGTKGYLLAPLLSKEFADYLIDNKPLSEEVNIQRFNTTI